MGFGSLLVRVLAFQREEHCRFETHLILLLFNDLQQILHSNFLRAIYLFLVEVVNNNANNFEEQDCFSG